MCPNYTFRKEEKEEYRAKFQILHKINTEILVAPNNSTLCDNHFRIYTDDPNKRTQKMTSLHSSAVNFAFILNSFFLLSFIQHNSSPFLDTTITSPSLYLKSVSIKL